MGLFLVGFGVACGFLELGGGGSLLGGNRAIDFELLLSWRASFSEISTLWGYLNVNVWSGIIGVSSNSSIIW